MATSRISSKATIPRRCTSSWRRRSMASSPRSSTFRARRARRRSKAAAVADDRAAHAQRLDRPEGSRRQARRGLLALAPGAAGRHGQARALKILEAWMRSYKPEELFDESGQLEPGDWPSWRRKGERRMGANPHANGGLLLRRSAAAGLPRLRRRSAGARRSRSAKPRASWAQFLRDVMKLNVDSRNFRLFGPDENNSNRWQDVLEVTDRAWMAEHLPDRRSPRAGRPRDGDPERAPVPGLARRLSADRPARLLLVLRGVHPHRRFDVQPARQVAEGHAITSLAAADRFAQLSAVTRTSGGRITTASATRTRASSITSSTRRPRSCASICRRMPTRCCR